jgi:hypothetical protein
MCLFVPLYGPFRACLKYVVLAHGPRPRPNPDPIYRVVPCLGRVFFVLRASPSDLAQMYTYSSRWILVSWVSVEKTTKPLGSCASHCNCTEWGESLARPWQPSLCHDHHCVPEGTRPAAFSAGSSIVETTGSVREELEVEHHLRVEKASGSLQSYSTELLCPHVGNPLCSRTNKD